MRPEPKYGPEGSPNQKLPVMPSPKFILTAVIALVTSAVWSKWIAPKLGL